MQDRTSYRLTRRRPWRRWLGLAILGLVLLVACDYYGYPRWARPGGRSFNRGSNGLYLRYTWYFGRRTDAEVRRLARRLREEQIRYAYFHTRSITAKGTLEFRYPDAARRLTAALHETAPSVKSIAWVSVANERGVGEVVNLSAEPVRRIMIKEAGWLVNECGFDGVQWDYEVCADGDEGFLQLLRQTRAALPKDKLLSVAAPVLSSRFYPWGWSEDYFARVARTCDQLTVMCYDTGIRVPRGYVSLVRSQARRATRGVARSGAGSHVLLGVPTYHAGGRSHSPHAENLLLALKGVREGLSDTRADRSAFEGVALLADWTTERNEWHLYRRLWF
ncbi:MAG: hypothetical protein JSV65_09035 [Armatimonadota bacterium]|nr:MAG: hypothetical protein JSV65_09035 [Armatimonadota bacterium]